MSCKLITLNQNFLAVGLCLGEGTGLALAIHMIEAGVKIYSEMASFKEAGVSGKPPS
ncbi:MAG: hypothetical protein CMH80_06030 [Nitrospinae bacterium]|nr:hypothetical protein [Nitrospinota bacterium]